LRLQFAKRIEEELAARECAARRCVLEIESLSGIADREQLPREPSEIVHLEQHDARQFALYAEGNRVITRRLDVAVKRQERREATIEKAHRISAGVEVREIRPRQNSRRRRERQVVDRVEARIVCQ